MMVPLRIAKSCTAPPPPGGHSPGRRSRSGRTPPSSAIPSSARSRAACRACRPPARSRSVSDAAAISSRRRRATCSERPSRKMHHLVDVGAVVVLGDRLDARSLAALDVVQQARPRQRAHALLDLDRARPEREQAADEVHRLVHAARARVRPEVARPVVGQLARALDAREVVGQRDLDVRVALVVLEPDVEARLVALDQRRFEQQRLADAVDDRVLDVGHAIHGLLDAQRRLRWPRLFCQYWRTRLRRLCALPT